jgi:hypothetical protein
MRAPTSLFVSWIARPKRTWITLIVSVVCLAAPFVMAWIEGSLAWLADSGRWRDVLVPPTIITYILAVAPHQAAMEARVLASLRPLLVDGDEALNQLARAGGGITPRTELVAFAIGVLVAVLLSAQGLLVGFTWLELVLLLEVSLMYGLLAIVIYGSLSSTRVTSALLRLPLRVDPLDVSPFEAIGRQSLLLSLVFVGGVTLSLLFIGVHPEIFLQWEFYVIYTPLISVSILVFFLNMAPTHRLLQTTRDAELKRVGGLIGRECAALVRQLEAGDEATAAAERISALTAYEARLLQARTWPYNTAMLRAAFVSVLIPGGTMVGRVMAELINR